jgi:peptidoglycan/LPS O-acetylase OafA/YrhL
VYHSANLDLLRASAVTMVISTHLLEINGHLQPWVVRLGHAGVMMFFVHTAFVLMQSLERLYAESPERLARRFYIRRFFRIYPLPVFMVVFVVGISKLWPLAVHPFFASYNPTPLQTAANLLLVQNLTGIKDIILVMWSLPPEVQMYAALPIFFLFRKSLPTSLILFWSGWVIMLTFISQTRAFEILQYVPMFLPGIIAYQYTKFVKPNLPSWCWPLAMGLPMAAFIRVEFNAVTLAFVACLVLGLSIPHFRPIESGLVGVTAKTVARYSYGIYLTHMPCIFVSFVLMASSPIIVRAGVFLLSLAGSSAVFYHALESPMLDYGARLASRLLPDVRKEVTSALSANA